MKYKLSDFKPFATNVDSNFVFEIDKTGHTRYFRAINGRGWAEVLKSEIEDDTAAAMGQACAAPLNSTYMNITFSKPLSRECPCGIVRADCEYHK